MAKHKAHRISVYKTFWGKDYIAKCNPCGKLGRATGQTKEEARQKAWNIGQKHRASSSGVRWIGP